MFPVSDSLARWSMVEGGEGGSCEIILTWRNNLSCTLMMLLTTAI